VRILARANQRLKRSAGLQVLLRRIEPVLGMIADYRL
jgi:hypothetical protein